MPERARDARVKPWQQAAQGLVSVLHVVRPPTRSLCTTTASARHVPQQRRSRAGFSPSGTRSEPPARQRRVALYLELGDGLGGGRGGLRSHAQNAHLVHAAGPRSARSRALSPASSRTVPVLVTTSSRGRDRAGSSCCTRRNTYSGSGSNRRPRVVVMKADFERALLDQATEASGTRVVVDVRAPKDAVAARASRSIDARGRRRC